MKALYHAAAFYRGDSVSSLDDQLSDRLAEAVDHFNSENDPAERVRLFDSIRELRAKLTVHPAPGTRENFEHGGAQ